MRPVRIAFTAAAALTLASVVMGAVVCATQSGAACPNWPGCYDEQFLPSVQAGLGENPLVEFSHRVVAGAAGPVVLAAAILGRRLPDARPRRLAWLGLAGTIAAGVFGMLIVRVGIPWWLGMLDLASALAATVAMLLARLLLDGPRWAPGRTARLAWAALGTLALLHLLGLAVAGPDSFTRCLGWPLGVLDADRWPVLQWLRLGLALCAAVLIVLAIVAAATRTRAWPALGLLLAEVLLGLALLAGAGGVGVRAAYAVVASLLFGAVAWLAATTSVRTVAREPVATAS